MLGGVSEVREKVAGFLGIVVGAELRHLRAVGPAIAAVDWAAHDQPWAPPAANWSVGDLSGLLVDRFVCTPLVGVYKYFVSISILSK